MDIVAITLHLLFEENTQVILTYIEVSTNFLIAESVSLVCTEFLNIQYACIYLSSLDHSNDHTQSSFNQINCIHNTTHKR